MIAELMTRNLLGGDLYISLKEWKSNESDPDFVEVGVEALSKAFAARVFMKRSGLRYDQLGRDTTNNYIAGSVHHPFTVEEAHRRIEYYVPPVSNKPKSNQNQVIGQQHYIGAKQGEFICLRCERGNPECFGVKTCTYDTKADGSAVNSQEVIDAKFREIKAAKRKRYKQKADKDKEEDKSDNNLRKEVIKTTDSQHIMNTEIVSSDNLWKNEDDFDGAYIDYSSVTINRASRQIIFDLRQKHKDHVYNQDSGGRKLREILLDSQSTCDVIINKAFLLRIRHSKWTLRLQTQAGECTINKIGDLPGVGVVWFYPEGVANILSQYRMAAYSKWNINNSTDRFRKTGNPKDLSYHCTTQEGIKCLFVPNPQGLHVLDASDKFSIGDPNSGYVFGKRVPDNGTNDGATMWAKFHNGEGSADVNDAIVSPQTNGVVITGVSKNGANITGVSDNPSIAKINTIAKSRSQYSARDRNKADMVRRFQQHQESVPYAFLTMNTCLDLTSFQSIQYPVL